MATVPSTHANASLGLWCQRLAHLDHYGLGLTKPAAFLRLWSPIRGKEVQHRLAGCPNLTHNLSSRFCYIFSDLAIMR